MADALVRVAVVGAGDVGRGWAALCVAHGWPVSLYDVEMSALLDAKQEVVARARSLALLKRADAGTVETGISSLELARSILEACGEARWVIEAGPEDLATKQKIFEAIESVAGGARAVTSSTSGLGPTDIAARCRRKERCFIAHPLNPPELIPLVELMPGPDADKATVELVKGWLHALGRIPVWREAIDMVLNGVIDVDDLDRAISLGPALGWAAAGPHLTYHLAAGDRGVAGFLQQLLRTFETIWEDLPTWSKLEPEQRRRLIHLIERTYEEQVDVIKPARDKRLAGVLWGLERSKDA
jgi:3-hydroxyacyl-CoA dehydrogenase